MVTLQGGPVEFCPVGATLCICHIKSNQKYIYIAPYVASELEAHKEAHFDLYFPTLFTSVI